MEYNEKHIKQMMIWLLCCCAAVFCIIIVGAITRLTESGLSIVEWKPLIGTIPPLNNDEWNRVFDLYKTSPEFQKKNFWMTLEDFKTIFFWEWFHRLIGRAIGLIFALPLFYFMITKRVPVGYSRRLWFIFFLGGAQGFMGWYMVKSGLVDQPAVSHYRLAAHLNLALLIYASLLWTFLDLKVINSKIQHSKDPALYRHGLITLVVLIVTIFWGAFTAGLDAGLVYNQTFPKMGENWVPSEIWFQQPYWLNLLENHAGVQFTHRWLALTTAAITTSFVLHAGLKHRKELAFPLIGIFVLVQVGLGIFTLLSGVNITIAVMHQAGAVILLTLMILCLHAIRPFSHTSPAH